MSRLFPRTEPYCAGMLDVGDDQSLYWEECGDPCGIPAVVLHGGPGSGCTPTQRRLFDPDVYRVILLDQRGAGRSNPRVGPLTTLEANDTTHLVADLGRLREHLGIERWVVYGVSWGVTLGLAYAQQHPDQVLAMVLSSVTMTRRQDIHWLYHEVGRFFPEQWQRFRLGVPRSTPNEDLVDGYHHLLNEQPDIGVRENAAKDWCDWEDAASPMPDGSPNARYNDPSFRMTFARIVTHYFHHGAWLSANQLLHNAHLLEGIPAVLVHGRLDLGAPLDTAWELARAWPDAELVVVDTGHTGGDPMTAAIIEAIDRFAALK